jgi:hypothetical protein
MSEREKYGHRKLVEGDTLIAGVTAQLAGRRVQTTELECR